MTRTTISIDDPLLRGLHRMAEERKMSIAAIIREAVEEKLATFHPMPGASALGPRATATQPGERAWR